MKLRNIDCSHIQSDGSCNVEGRSRCVCLDKNFCVCRFPHEHSGWQKEEG